MGIAFILCLIVLALFYFAGIRSANRIDESIRVRMEQSLSREEERRE